MGGKEILSCEGTTQGDPCAMPAYTIGIAPLLQLINLRDVDAENPSDGDQVKHAAYADYLGGAGILESLLTWWNRVVHFVPPLGYYPKASKSWLVVKDHRVVAARKIFAHTDINITSQRRAYLGGFATSQANRINAIHCIKEKSNCQRYSKTKAINQAIAVCEPLTLCH